MVEELSPESKLYLKEELEKVRNEFKEGLKDAQSKTTKIFTTIALIVGLLASMGIYGLVKDYMKTTIQTAIDDKLGKEAVDEFDELKSKAQDYVKDACDLHDKIVEYEKEGNKLWENLSVREKIMHLPIGTIVTSMLAPDEYAVAVGNPDVFDSNESYWELADGNDVITDSQYYQKYKKQKLPDLRGMFLRGMNVNGGQDPDPNRIAGGYQGDALQQHGHETNARQWDWNIRPKAQTGFTSDSSGLNAHPANVTKVTDLMGEKINVDNETRPKNVAVYFYIKIN